MKPEYILHLRKSATQYYTVQNNAVMIVPNITPLADQDNTIDGITVGYGRDSSWWGVFRSYSPGIKFVQEAARILRYVHSTEGCEGICQFEVWGLNATTQTHSQLFVVDVDFLTFKSFDLYVEVAFMEQGIKADLFANRATPFEIPYANNGTWQSVRVGGLPLIGKHSYVTAPFSYTAEFPPVLGVEFYLPINNYAVEGSYQEATDNDVLGWDPAFPTYLNDVGGFVANRPLSLVKVTLTPENIFYSIPNTWFQTGKLAIRVFLYTESAPLVAYAQYDLYIDPGTALNPGQSRQLNGVTGQVGFPMNKGDKAVIAYQILIAGGVPGTAGNVHIAQQGTGANVFFETTFSLEYSVVKGLPFHRLFYQLSDKLTGVANSALSTFLTTLVQGTYANQPVNTMVAPGTSVRAMPDGNIKIVTSMDDLSKAAKSIWGLGLGIVDNKVRIEKLSFFFQKDVLIVDLGEIEEVNITQAENLMANTYENGYVTNNNDELNGLQAFNTERTYRLPLKRVKRNINDVCPYNADCYTVEFLRSKMKSKDTMDNINDKENFIIEYNPGTLLSGLPVVYRPPGSIAGVLFPTGIYNYALTPRMNAYRNGPHLKSILHLRDGKTITFQTTDKNPDLVTAIQGQSLMIEKNNIDVNVLAAPLFFPIYFEFECPAPEGFMAMLNANPYGVIRFKYKGKVFDGFLWDTSLHPLPYSTVRTFKLLCSPNVNMTNFVFE